MFIEGISRTPVFRRFRHLFDVNYFFSIDNYFSCYAAHDNSSTLISYFSPVLRLSI